MLKRHVNLRIRPRLQKRYIRVYAKTSFRRHGVVEATFLLRLVFIGTNYWEMNSSKAVKKLSNENTLSCLVFCINFTADSILKYFFLFSQKTVFDISCKLSPLETICMKRQIMFSRKNKKNIIHLSSAVLAQTDRRIRMCDFFLFILFYFIFI